jgi:hypothetical protein
MPNKFVIKSHDFAKAHITNSFPETKRNESLVLEEFKPGCPHHLIQESQLTKKIPKSIGNPSIITQGAPNPTNREPLLNILAAKQSIHHSDKWAFTKQHKFHYSRKLDNYKNGVRKFYALLSGYQTIELGHSKIYI